MENSLFPHCVLSEDSIQIYPDVLDRHDGEHEELTGLVLPSPSGHRDRRSRGEWSPTCLSHSHPAPCVPPDTSLAPHHHDDSFETNPESPSPPYVLILSVGNVVCLFTSQLTTADTLYIVSHWTNFLIQHWSLAH